MSSTASEVDGRLSANTNLYPLCFIRGFKALKQIVKLYFKMGQPDKIMEAYR